MTNAEFQNDEVIATASPFFIQHSTFSHDLALRLDLRCSP